MIEIITENDNWNALLLEFDGYDTYHTFDYHQATKSEGETPILIKYTEKDIIIAIPLLLREIKNTSYKDATSVYGYPGPLAKNVTKDFDNSLFAKTLISFFKEKNIISVFSRLNPFLKTQKRVLKNLGDLFKQGQVVNINLKLDLDTQRQNYNRRLKNHINKSRKLCRVIQATGKEHVKTFLDIYTENMDRVEAKKSYYFNESYFNSLLESKDFETEMLLAIDNESNDIISGAMFLKKNNIVQYHLSGTKDDFLHLMPTKLLIDEMRLKATEEGYKIFNLGGGLGGRDDDSLFRFKSSFSNDFHTYCIWKLIVDEAKYEEMCERNNLSGNESPYFPLYRLEH